VPQVWVRVRPDRSTGPSPVREGSQASGFFCPSGRQGGRPEEPHSGLLGGLVPRPTGDSDGSEAGASVRMKVQKQLLGQPRDFSPVNALYPDKNAFLYWTQRVSALRFTRQEGHARCVSQHGRKRPFPAFVGHWYFLHSMIVESNLLPCLTYLSDTFFFQQPR
jgi:hypothetical protein